MLSSPYVSVGWVCSAQGIKGELFVRFFTRKRPWEDRWESLILSSKNGDEAGEFLKILNKRPHKKKGQSGFVLKLKFVEDRTQAEEFVGRKVFVPKNFLKSDNDEIIDLREILNFRVLDKTRGDVGRVVGFSGSSKQDTLIISGCGGEFEAPFVPPIHLSTDKEKGTLMMDIPMGLVYGEDL